MRKISLLILFAGLLHITLSAQDTAAIQKDYKNSIRFNVTNPLLFGGKSLIFGYERVMKNNRSFTINIGQSSFPRLRFKDSDSLRTKPNVKENGFHISADYRFYLPKQNKYDAPRGVFIGPYYAYNYFEKTNSWTVKSTSGGTPQTIDSKTMLTTNCVGFELGYQFVFWNRLSIDMILIGPGIASYNLEAKLSSNLSEEDRQKFYEKLNAALADKFPGYSTVIDEGEFQRSGTANSTNLGYRYMMLIGVRF